MTWREKLVIQILLLVARMVVGNPVIDAEIKALSTHISIHGDKFKDAA